MKKISRPKKLSTEEFDAQYALSSAVVRGSFPRNFGTTTPKIDGNSESYIIF